MSISQSAARRRRTNTTAETAEVAENMIQSEYGVISADGLMTEAQLEALNMTFDDILPDDPALSGGMNI